MIKKSLLPHQYELLSDNDTKILGMVAGYGSGKTFAVCRKAIVLMSINAGYDGVITEPTYPMLADILIPELHSALTEYGISYKFNKSEKTFVCMINNKETRILCRSMENYTRLVGVNAAWVIMDELDTAKQDIAYAAYSKLIGRIRSGNKRQMVIVSTPEGFRALHRIFVSEIDKGDKRLIKAKSTDNKYLPTDYIETLIGNYSAELQQAYINGEFVNMHSGSVYRNYDRHDNNCNTEIQSGEPLYIGQDFNVYNMASVIAVMRNDQLHVVKELSGLIDTNDVCDYLTDNYSNHTIYIYPDASGRSRKTVGSSVSDIKILESAGFTVRAKKTNPAVKDRVLSVNMSFDKRKLFVNYSECPELVKGLEQQAYDSAGRPDKSSGLDHMVDALGYLVNYEFPVHRPTVQPVAVPVY